MAVGSHLGLGSQLGYLCADDGPAAVVVTGRCPHRVLNASHGFALLARDALNVDPQQVHAVVGPLATCAAGRASVEPGRDGGMAQDRVPWTMGFLCVQPRARAY